MTQPIYILNGPNLNRLGTREPEIYGTTTLGDIKASCQMLANAAQIPLEFRQTNLEGELVTWVQEVSDKGSALVLNAAAYTHTSVALLDALKLLDVPVIEVHLSNPAAREEFRQTNYVSPAATSGVFGFGAMGYTMAMEAVIKTLRPSN
jgi:3-dehydroquinate dehydratase-2